MKANAEITAPTIRLSTSKERAKIGSTGTSTPKPTATQKAITPSTMTSRGRPCPGKPRRDGTDEGGIAQGYRWRVEPRTTVEA
ncbi:hypothetical protein GCM10009638_00080 [Luteococcus sanguinis]